MHMEVTKLTTDKILENIEKATLFEGESSEGGFYIKIGRYVPYICTAIHHGSRLRPELQKKIHHSDYQRWFEEDPYTGDFIASMPITITGLDSRFEYDLNRHPSDCIYQEAWGKKVWKRPLTHQEINKSKRKHAAYYKVLHALVERLEKLFGGCVVYDIHSYNYKRWEKDVPLFNLGTELIDRKRFGPAVDEWLMQLSKIALPDIVNETRENDVFFGRGYNLEYLTTRFSNTLVLATEIKKVFCDELTGDLYPEIIRNLQHQFKRAILDHANFFGHEYTRWKHSAIPKLLDKQLNGDLLTIDSNLHNLLKNFELLAAVNPINSQSEKKKFFKNRYTELPQFRYNPVKINPYQLKQKIFSLPLKQIGDVSVRTMYESVVNSYADKIDMIGSLNSRVFLYNSLRYFGRPTQKDLSNAAYIMLLPEIPGEAQKEPVYNATQAIEIFREALIDYGIEAKIELSNKVISQVLVLNSKKSILFQPQATFKHRELKALIEHEIGVHMVTTINSNLQKIKLFNIGLPVNTHTQEGLALLAEYLSGNLTLKRLKKIALRVIIVDMMCSGADFIECFQTLINEYKADPNEAFSMVTRIFRGGGYTKDYLYLSGFVEIFRLWEEQFDLTPLLIGKTSLSFYDTIDEMIGREMVAKPTFITKSFLSPQSQRKNSIYNYIFSGLR